MNYKLEGAIRRNKKNFIFYLIIWIVISIFLIPPFVYSSFSAGTQGSFDVKIFLENFQSSITNPIGSFSNMISVGAIGNYFNTIFWFTIIYIIFFIVSIVKSAPKNEYSDIEHGSSDWSHGGEQYRILNNKQGIILAENNYLPVDKRGNVNVLVVGRIRIW